MTSFPPAALTQSPPRELRPPWGRNLPPGPARCEASSLVPVIGPGTIRAPPPLMRAAVPRRRSCGSAAPPTQPADPQLHRRYSRRGHRTFSPGRLAAADGVRQKSPAKLPTHPLKLHPPWSGRLPPATLRKVHLASARPPRDDNPSALPLKLRPSWDVQPPPRARPVPRSLDGRFSSIRHGTAPSRPLLRVGVPRQSSSGSAPPTHPARRPSAPLSPQPPLSPRLSAPQIGSAGSAELLPPSPASRRAPGEQLRVRGPPRPTGRGPSAPLPVSAIVVPAPFRPADWLRKLRQTAPARARSSPRRRRSLPACKAGVSVLEPAAETAVLRSSRTHTPIPHPPTLLMFFACQPPRPADAAPCASVLAP